VRINDGDGNPLSSVHIALEDDEARELIDALATLPDAPNGWHAHGADAEHAAEITIYRADDGTTAFANPPT
jgi:hypothetical protein